MLMKAIKRALRRGINTLQKKLQRADAASLLVTRDVGGEKTQRMLARLRFYAPRATFTPVSYVSSRQVFASQLVVEADEGLVPERLRWRLDNVYKADFERYPLDGWELSRISEHVDGLPTANRRIEAQARLRSAVSVLRAQQRQCVYIFGTGRSLERASEREFFDGYRIVCNTIVRDPELWRHLQPDFLVAGDAIYHFGHTAHARAFRDDARRRLAESRDATLFVYPEVFDAVVRREFIGLESQLVPVPAGQHDCIEADLVSRFELPAIANVLNRLLLPLGCTLSRTVRLWGFDGRAPDDKGFWANSDKQSYPELMAELRAEHPAFFSTLVPAGRESEYVKTVHGDSLELRLRRAEANGFRFEMMHFSWTETLNRRAAKLAGSR